MEINRLRKQLRKCRLSLVWNTLEFHRIHPRFFICSIYLARDYLHNRYGEDPFAGDSIERNRMLHRQRDLSRSCSPGDLARCARPMKYPLLEYQVARSTRVDVETPQATVRDCASCSSIRFDSAGTNPQSLTGCLWKSSVR